MVYDPSQIARGYLAGRQAKMQEKEAGQLSRMREMQMEQMQRQEERERRVAEKEQRVQGLLGQLYGGTGAQSEAARSGLLSMGEVESVSKYDQMSREDRERMQEDAVKGLGYVTNAIQAGGIPDSEWRSMLPEISEMAEMAGVPENMVRSYGKQIMQMPAQQGQELFMRIMSPEKDEKITGDYKTYVDKETGETITLNEADPRDQRLLREKRDVLIPAPTRQETGAPGAFAATKKEIETLRESEIATRNAIDTANDIIMRIEENPEAFSAVGKFATFATGLSNELKVAAEQLGVDIPDEVARAENYADTFEELGIKSAREQGLLVDLSLAYASAIGLGKGRELSENDVTRAMKRIGADALGTPEMRKTVISDIQRVLARNYKNRYKVIAGKDFEGEFDIYEGGKKEQKKEMKFTEGQRVTQGGVTYVYTNGEMIPEQ